MGPFYNTKASASTTCAARRIGNLAVETFTAKNLLGESLSDAQSVASNSFNLLENGNLHQGRKPASTGK